MSPRANELLTVLHKWTTVIFLPVLTYFAVKIDRKVDFSYDAVTRHEQMWIAQNRINDAIDRALTAHAADIKELARSYNIAVRDNSRAVN